MSGIFGGISNRIKGFAASLRQDYDAVHAALSQPWSTGSVEGHINRLKLIKRDMYGRDGFDLLRSRELAAAWGEHQQRKPLNRHAHKTLKNQVNGADFGALIPRRERWAKRIVDVRNLTDKTVAPDLRSLGQPHPGDTGSLQELLGKHKGRFAMSSGTLEVTVENLETMDAGADGTGGNLGLGAISLNLVLPTINLRSNDQPFTLQKIEVRTTDHTTAFVTEPILRRAGI